MILSTQKYIIDTKGCNMKYKLGLDLGSTSLGWAIVELNEKDTPIRLVDMGVRIFPDGRDAQSHTPINAVRRQARQMRRRVDRIHIRKKRVLQLIHKYGMDFDIRTDKNLENPYELRVRALTQKLFSSELGRVLFHLSLRRGFKSTRKETRGEDGGKLKRATTALRTAMGDETLAQFQMQTGKYRFANQFDGTTIKDGALYPTRDMYLDEFREICKAQNLLDNIRQEFERAIFRQSPLKPVDVGKCVFEPEEPRAYKFEPDFQKWRALQQLNQLAILDKGIAIPLTGEQRSKLFNVMFNTFDGVSFEKNGRAKITFAKIKQILGLSRTSKFNLESEKRKDLDSDATGGAFYKIGEIEFWNARNDAEKSDILNRINDDKTDDSDLINYLVQEYGISAERAEQIIDIPLEEGVSNVSLKAIRKMLPFLEQGDLYHTAAQKVWGKHSDKDIPELVFLPYYGDLTALRSSLVLDKNGVYRTMNATVHIAMNQIRAVVNDLIHQYGKPYAINIEMGRDTRAGAQERSEIDAQQAKNKRENDRIRKELASIDITNPSREDFQKFKLWEALAKKPQDRMCVYTGRPITSLTELFKSGNFEIEHILPFSLTLDDSLANKTISAIDANKFKGNRIPYDAFNDPASPWSYDDVLRRAQNLPDSTKWRFNENAMERYLKDNPDCIARALNDTRHMTKMAVTYLQHICNNKSKVVGVNGQMTAMFRDMWHLNWWKDRADADKYRGSHIHHAIDAFVITCISPNMYYHIARNASTAEHYFGKSQKEKRDIWFADMATPFDGFDYYDFKMKCENTIISYRKSIKDPRENGTVGCLHEETAYNLESFENDKTIKATMSRRVELPKTDEKREKFKKDFKNINKTTLQMFLSDTGVTNDDADIVPKFLDWCTARGIKKLRMLKNDVDISTYIPVFRTKKERNEYLRAYENWYVADGISAGIKNKHAKQEQLNKERELLDNFKSAAKRAYKWYVGGNNFCADIFEIRSDDKRYPKDAGKWKVDIVSNYMAETKPGVSLWHKKYPTARRIMSLRINDMVMAEFSKDDSQLPSGIRDTVAHQCAVENKDTVNMVFRVKKLNSSGTIYLRPHFIAKEDADTKSWIASTTSLKEHKARKISVSPTGKILK